MAQQTNWAICINNQRIVSYTIHMARDSQKLENNIKRQWTMDMDGHDHDHPLRDQEGRKRKQRGFS